MRDHFIFPNSKWQYVAAKRGKHRFEQMPNTALKNLGAKYEFDFWKIIKIMAVSIQKKIHLYNPIH